MLGQSCLPHPNSYEYMYYKLQYEFSTDNRQYSIKAQPPYSSSSYDDTSLICDYKHNTVYTTYTSTLH